MQYMNIQKIRNLVVELEEELAKPSPFASEHDEVLTTSEVAKLLKISQSKVARLAITGELPGTKFGSQWRFRRSDIEKGLNS